LPRGQAVVDFEATIREATADVGSLLLGVPHSFRQLARLAELLVLPVDPSIECVQMGQ